MGAARAEGPGLIGYLDTPSGISGDMFLGCLVDASWPLLELEKIAARLPVPRQSWSIQRYPNPG